jgi:hypothetical protein
MSTARVVFLLAAALALCACDALYIRNHAISELFAVENGDVYNPVVAPDGRTVYFLRDDRGLVQRGYEYVEPGAIWRIRIGEEVAAEVNPGPFSAIAMAPDGARLAAIRRDTLLLLDTTGAEVGVIATPDSLVWSIVDVEFSRDGSWVYWLGRECGSYGQVWRGRPDGTERELVRDYIGSAETRVRNFDLDARDSVYLDRMSGVNRYPQFNLASAEHEAVDVGGFFTLDLCVGPPGGNRSEQDALPERSSHVRDPYWFPSGDTIVYSANSFDTPYGLWLLTKVDR